MEPSIGINFSVFFSSLVNAAPGLAVWIVALALSIVLFNRGGGRPERLLIIGSGLMLASTFLSVFVPVIQRYLIQSGLTNVSAAGVISGINIFLGLISLAGIICLFYAIWKKFTERTNIITGDY
jgi:ABC-type multidrug transport system fused ATPase/permease subunit